VSAQAVTTIAQADAAAVRVTIAVDHIATIAVAVFVQALLLAAVIALLLHVKSANPVLQLVVTHYSRAAGLQVVQYTFVAVADKIHADGAGLELQVAVAVLV
jgi:hypothetical protein